MWDVSFCLRGGPPEIVPSHTAEELAAIGHITVMWAHLEHLLFQHTEMAADFLQVPVPTDAHDGSVKRRARAWLALLKLLPDDVDGLPAFLGAAKRILELELQRHRITHGIWEWKPHNPSALRAGSFRPGFEFNEPFDRAKLEKLARGIGAVCFVLTYPGGKEDVMQDLAQPGLGASRSFHLMLQAGRERDHPQPQSKPKAGAKPQA